MNRPFEVEVGFLNPPDQRLGIRCRVSLRYCSPGFFPLTIRFGLGPQITVSAVVFFVAVAHTMVPNTHAIGRESSLTGGNISQSFGHLRKTVVIVN